MSDPARYDTSPKLLMRNAETMADRPAYREKDLGIWQSWSWRETAAEVRAFACGLSTHGIGRGDKVAIIGANRPQLYWSFDALQSIGAIPVPLYADSVAEEMKFVLDHAEVMAAICEDQEQIDKVLSIKDDLPSLRLMVYEDDRGMRKYTENFLFSFASVQDEGRQFDTKNPDFFADELGKSNGSDVAIIAYTSGTTGNPKGVILNFDNLIKSAELFADLEKLTPDDEILAYLPLAWVGDHFMSVAAQRVVGCRVNCPESSDTVMLDLRDIGPTIFIAPPAIFESFLTQIKIRMDDAGAMKRKMYDWAIALAGRVGIDKLEGRSVSFIDRVRYRLGDFLMYAPLKNILGLSRMRFAYTGGAPLGDEVFNFYRSVGLNLKQLYGQTESTAYCCIQRDGDVKSDTVGPPCPGCEVKITDGGEIIYKSPGTFVGYFKNEEATKETLDDDGWVHTGDAGIIDDGGHLKVIDRAKDVGTLTDGTLFAPQYIENKLKFFPFIREAVAHGADKDYVTAFINIDLEAVGNWAERNGISYTSYSDLANHDDIYGLIGGCIEEVNQGLASDSALENSQIRRFLILHKELDADDGELTRTRKLRRRIIADRYGELIDALFSDRENVSVEAEMTFEDGRKGVIKADLKLRDVTVFGGQDGKPALTAAA